MNIVMTAADHSPRILSSIPGRIRWSVAELRGSRRAAQALQQDLSRHPQVLSVSANHVTGSVLLTFNVEASAEEAGRWLEASLRRREAMDDAAIESSNEIMVGNTLVGFKRHEQDPNSAQVSPLKRLMADTQPYAPLRNRAIAATLADGLANAIPPLLVSLAVGVVSNPSGSFLARFGLKTVAGRVAGLGLISAGYWVGAALLEFYRERTASEFADQVRRDLRLQVYDHVQRLDVATIEQRSVSDWMAVIQGDIEEVHRFLRHGGKPLMTIASNVIVVGGSFLVISPLLGLVQLMVIPPVMLASRQMLQPLRARIVAARNVDEQVAATIAGNLAGIATVASFSAEDTQAERIQEAVSAQLEASRDANQLEAAYVPTLRAIVGGGFVSTVTLGASRVMSGQISVAGLDVLAYGQLRLMAALARGGTGLEEFQKTAASLERIYETLDLESPIRSGTDPLPSSGAPGELAFRKVTFGYDPREPVLRDFDLTIAPGTTVGIVGASGAGKSTLFKLLMRFYDPQHGEVTLYGKAARTLELASIRSAFSVVPQEITLFSGTVRENIALGRPDAPMAVIEDAARAAAAHDFIVSLPDGYDTRLGFGGLSLSGGQRQRIAIARAFVADRPFLLFDEATSSLDHHTEVAVQRSLRALRGGRTTVIIAHRLSTVRQVDCIHVMDAGQIIESGTHDELVALRGVYANMWMIQTGQVGAG